MGEQSLVPAPAPKRATVCMGLTERSNYRIWYPLLAAAFVVLHQFDALLSNLRIQDLWLPLTLEITLCGLLWFLASLIFRSRAAGACFATVVVFACYTYGRFDHFAHHALGNLTLVAWTLLTLSLAVFAGLKWRWHKQANVFASLLVLVAVGSTCVDYIKLPRSIRRVPQSLPMLVASTTRPDIYYIILDAYGRHDQLQRVLGLDNSSFLNALRQRGFYVAPLCHSNYVQTELSISSSLNMDFIQRLLTSNGSASNDSYSLVRLTDQSAVATCLRSVGYEVDAITSGFTAFPFSYVDRRFGPKESLTPIESVLLERSPYSGIEDLLGHGISDRRKNLLDALANLRKIGAEPHTKPRFVIAHILAPHPSFVFLANGENPRSSHGGDISDGSDFFDHGGSAAAYKIGYSGQTQWLDSQILAALDTILARSKTPPVILLQGDHGSRMGMKMNSYEGTDFEESTSNLMAFLVPLKVREQLYPSITPVNSFRILLSVLFNANLGRRPDLTWYSPYDHPYEFTDVTGIIHAADRTSGVTAGNSHTDNSIQKELGSK